MSAIACKSSTLFSVQQSRYGNEAEKWQSCGWLFLVCTLYFILAVLKKDLTKPVSVREETFSYFTDQTRVLLAFSFFSGGEGAFKSQPSLPWQESVEKETTGNICVAA